MINIKHEWRKHEKDTYLPKNKAVLKEIPKYKYIILDGIGNPNGSEFSEAIGVLYSISYAVKMLPKKGINPEGYFDYTVYPLEAIWKLQDDNEQFSKENLHYRVMIRQPDYLTLELFNIVLEMVAKKKPHEKLKDVSLEVMDEGKVVQCLHVGSYDNEQDTFDIMATFCEGNGLERYGMYHREIYLSDPRKVEIVKLKTVLRISVKENI